MSFEMFLLLAGTLATGVSVTTAVIYERFRKRSFITSVKETEKLQEALTIHRQRAQLNKTKVNIKIDGNSITLTAQDMDVETLERLLETLTAEQTDSRMDLPVNEYEGEKGEIA